MHLFFGLAESEEGIKSPAKNSLLARLWPVIGSRNDAVTASAATDTHTDEWRHPLIRRYDAGWIVPRAPEAYRPRAPVAVDESLREVTYDWASPLAKHVGTVVHRWLEKITREGAENFTEANLQSLRPLFSHMLNAEDIDAKQLEQGTEMVATALSNTLKDPTGQWLVNDTHEASVCEFPVTVMRDNRMQSLIIDRTFVDDAGVRWIVDYKTSSHEGGGLDAFLNEEERRHSEQLESYRQAMQLLEPEREIKTALYFPLLQKLHEVICD
jgi:ATP-dependent exoDNAse (exonuclease V) beta subunit